jgi:hypothetical protein
LGHNAATVTRPNCFGWYFFRLKRFSEIGLAVLPEAKLFSGPIFRVKNEFQNWIPEFATRYGMPVGAAGTGTASPAGLARPATGHGHRLRPGLPATDRPPATHGTAARPRVAGCGHGYRTRPDTDGHGHGKPATVKTWQSAGTVAAGFKQKAGNP